MATDLRDSSGHHLEDRARNGIRKYVFSTGTTVPTHGTSGYSVGAVFIHVDGGSIDAVYINEGSSTECYFNPIVTSKGGGAVYFDVNSSIRFDATLNILQDTSNSTILFDAGSLSAWNLAESALSGNRIYKTIPIVVDGDTSSVKYIPVLWAD